MRNKCLVCTSRTECCLSKSGYIHENAIRIVDNIFSFIFQRGDGGVNPIPSTIAAFEWMTYTEELTDISSATFFYFAQLRLIVCKKRKKANVIKVALLLLYCYRSENHFFVQFWQGFTWERICSKCPTNGECWFFIQVWFLFLSNLQLIPNLKHSRCSYLKPLEFVIGW